MKEMKAKLVGRASRRLNYNTEYIADTEILGDFFDEGVLILTNWRKLKNDNEFLSGKHDVALINFMVESFGYMGMEGQSYSANNGRVRQYLLDPKAKLQSSVPQIM